jgi:GNAT superfamily N-acetyltransferase
MALTEDQGEDYKQLWDISEKVIVPHRLAVDPKARGKGVALLLMKQAEKLSQVRGYDSIRCDTNNQNKGAQVSI